MIKQLTINDYIRIFEEVDYILNKNCSLSETARLTKRPVSLINKDIIYDLALIDPQKQKEIKARIQDEKRILHIESKARHGIYYIKRI